MNLPVATPLSNQPHLIEQEQVKEAAAGTQRAKGKRRARRAERLKNPTPGERSSLRLRKGSASTGVVKVNQASRQAADLCLTKDCIGDPAQKLAFMLNLGLIPLENKPSLPIVRLQRIQWPESVRTLQEKTNQPESKPGGLSGFIGIRMTNSRSWLAMAETKEDALVSESRGLYSRKLNYIRKGTGAAEGALEQVFDDVGKTKSSSSNHQLNSFLLTIRQVFLPYGYPNSVSKDYMKYQIYDTIQAFCSSLTGALATEAVMKGVGVGDDSATPLAAAVTWLLKSGSGMVGQIVFTWYQGTNLDCNSKKWRFFADAVNDTAIFIDLLSPLFSANLRLPIFCLSSVARSLVGVAGGATRAAITQHQARCNNMADVSAKDGSQETLVNLVALIASLVILPAVSGNFTLVWTLFITFTICHLLANYKALKSLHLESLNNARLLYNLSSFLQTETVVPVDIVNDLESVVLGFGIEETDVTSGGYQIKLGVSLDEALPSSKSSGGSRKYPLETLQVAMADSAKNGKNFLIFVDPILKRINVVLHENIPPWEIIEAYSRSVFLSHIINEVKAQDVAMEQTDTKWSKFEAALSGQGYAKDRALLQVGDWRACWRKLH